MFVPVAGLAAIGRCRPDADKLDAAAGESGVYVFCAETVEPGHDFHARMFALRLGIREDPATGSAAAAFARVIGFPTASTPSRSSRVTRWDARA